MLQVITHASLTVDEIVQWYEPDALQRYGLAAIAMILDGSDRDMATDSGALAGHPVEEEEEEAGVEAGPHETTSPGCSSSRSGIEDETQAPVPSSLASCITAEPNGILPSTLRTGSCRAAAQVCAPSSAGCMQI